MDYKDTYDTDTSKAQASLAALSGKASGVADKIGGAAGKLGEMKGRVEGAADSVEIFSVGLASFAGESDAAKAATEGLAAGAQTLALGFAFGGVIGAGLAAGALAIKGLGQAYTYMTSEVTKSADEIKSNFVAGLSEEERSLKRVQNEIAALTAKKDLDSQQQIEMLELLKEEKTAQEAVKTATEARAKAQEALNKAIEVEKSALEEMIKLRNVPTSEEQGRAENIKKYLADNPEAQAKLAEDLLRSSGSAKEAKIGMDQILAGKGSSVISSLASMQAQNGGVDPGLADIRSIQRGELIRSQRAQQVQSPLGFDLAQGTAVDPSEQRIGGLASSLGTQVDSAGTDARAMGALFQRLTQELADAKASRDELLSNAIESAQEAILTQLQKTAQIRASIGQQRGTILPKW